MNANIEWLIANAGRGDIILSAVVMVAAIFCRHRIGTGAAVMTYWIIATLLGLMFATLAVMVVA